MRYLGWRFTYCGCLFWVGECWGGVVVYGVERERRREGENIRLSSISVRVSRLRVYVYST